MRVSYDPDADFAVVMWHREVDATSLRYDDGVVAGFATDGCEDDGRVVALEISSISKRLPLETAEGYDAATDTLTLGRRPESWQRVVENGDVVSYWQDFSCGSGDNWDLVAVDLRRASVNLAKVIAAAGGLRAVE